MAKKKSVKNTTQTQKAVATDTGASVKDSSGWACNICGKRPTTFNSMEDLKEHQQKCHRGIVERNHTCKKCGRYFRDAEKLRKHTKKSCV